MVQVAVMFFCFDLFGINLSVSTAVAYILSVLIHFLGNRYYTFSLKPDLPFVLVAKYLLIVIFNFFLTLGVTVVSVLYFGVYPALATAISVCCSFACGYYANRFWVFDSYKA